MLNVFDQWPRPGDAGLPTAATEDTWWPGWSPRNRRFFPEPDVLPLSPFSGLQMRPLCKIAHSRSPYRPERLCKVSRTLFLKVGNRLVAALSTELYKRLDNRHLARLLVLPLGYLWGGTHP